MDNDMRERLAAVQHDIWAHWMRYQFSVCLPNGLGGALIPSDKAERWQRQMDTPYADLTDKEQQSDRHQADKVLGVVQPELDQLRAALAAANARAKAAEADLASLRAQLDPIRQHLATLDAVRRKLDEDYNNVNRNGLLLLLDCIRTLAQQSEAQP